MHDNTCNNQAYPGPKNDFATSNPPKYQNVTKEYLCQMAKDACKIGVLHQIFISNYGEYPEFAEKISLELESGKEKFKNQYGFLPYAE